MNIKLGGAVVGADPLSRKLKEVSARMVECQEERDRLIVENRRLAMELNDMIKRYDDVRKGADHRRDLVKSNLELARMHIVANEEIDKLIEANRKSAEEIVSLRMQIEQLQEALRQATTRSPSKVTDIVVFGDRPHNNFWHPAE